MPKNILIFSNGTGQRRRGQRCAVRAEKSLCRSAFLLVSWPLWNFSASEAPQEVGQRDAHRISRALATGSV